MLFSERGKNRRFLITTKQRIIARLPQCLDYPGSTTKCRNKKRLEKIRRRDNGCIASTMQQADPKAINNSQIVLQQANFLQRHAVPQVDHHSPEGRAQDVDRQAHGGNPYTGLQGEKLAFQRACFDKMRPMAALQFLALRLVIDHEEGFNIRTLLAHKQEKSTRIVIEARIEAGAEYPALGPSFDNQAQQRAKDNRKQIPNCVEQAPHPFPSRLHIRRTFINLSNIVGTYQAFLRRLSSVSLIRVEDVVFV